MKANDFKNKIEKSWLQLYEKKKTDKKFQEEKAGIKVYDNYWITLNKNNLPGIIIKLDSKINIKTLKFPKGKGWNFTESENKIIMNVNEEKYKDFFVKLINLILTKIFLENLIGEKSIKCFLENLFSAKDFFEEENVPRKLTLENQIGLFGEVYVLSKLITKKLSNEIAIKSWTGPSKKHDFTTENLLSEIKTTTTDTKKINTSSTNQIAPVFDKRLDLVFLQLDKSNTGTSLNEIINEYYKILGNESEISKNEFDLKLTQSNYLDIHKNDYSQKYKVNKANFFEINKEFPYIKNVEHTDEISDLTITYKIDLDKCEKFRVNEDKFLNSL